MKTHICIDSRCWDVSADDLFLSAEASDARANGGRGTVVFFSRHGTEFVRKHYKRGGWVRRFARDRYIYTGLAKTRMWREYRLLKDLKALGLPVPEPVAARCICHGPFFYSGDVVTVRLDGAETLGAILRREPLPDQVWAEIGTTLARFHEYHVYHADLNIDNIMLGRECGVALIDFDRGAIRPNGRRIWMPQTMQRLLRSFNKARLNAKTFHFSTREWQILTEQHGKCMRGGSSRENGPQTTLPAPAGSIPAGKGPS